MFNLNIMGNNKKRRGKKKTYFRKNDLCFRTYKKKYTNL